MARNIPCDIDRFAATIEQLVGDVPEQSADGMEKAARQTVRSTAKKLRGEFTDGIGVHEWSKEYREGFSSKTDRAGLTVSAEVGNRNKPGLVHLLEDGHATLTGRRTRRFPHMEPAFIDMEDDFMRRVPKAVGEELRR